MIFNININNLRDINFSVDFFHDYIKDIIFFVKLYMLYIIQFLSYLKNQLINNYDNPK